MKKLLECKIGDEVYIVTKSGEVLTEKVKYMSEEYINYSVGTRIRVSDGSLRHNGVVSIHADSSILATADKDKAYKAAIQRVNQLISTYSVKLNELVKSYV